MRQRVLVCVCVGVLRVDARKLSGTLLTRRGQTSTLSTLRAK